MFIVESQPIFCHEEEDKKLESLEVVFVNEGASYPPFQMKNIHEAGAANSYIGILYSVEGRVGFGGTPMTDSARSFASPLFPSQG